MLPHRPAHLRTRPALGRQFTEDAALVTFPDRARSTSNGRWVQGDATETDIMVSAAPIKEDDARSRESLPEGMRDKEAYRFWTPTELDADAGDRIRYPAVGGITYLVVGVSRWWAIYSCLAVKLDPQPA